MATNFTVNGNAATTDAPPDLHEGGDGLAELPAALAGELAGLALI